MSTLPTLPEDTSVDRADRCLFQGLATPATLIDADGIIVDVNDAFLNYAPSIGTDVSRSERVGRHLADFTNDASLRQQLCALVRQLFAAGGSLTVSTIAQDSRLPYAELEASLISTAQGPLGLVLRRDITATVRAKYRDRAVNRLRQRVWQMRSSEDLGEMLIEICDGLLACRVPFEICSVHLIPMSTHSRMRSFVMARDQAHWQDIGGEDAELIRQFQRAGGTVYRRDLSTADPYDERARLQRRIEVRSVVDVPFSGGTLSVNSLQPSAFNEDDLSLLMAMAKVLDDGFRRLHDLERLAEGGRRASALMTTIEAVALEDDLESIFDRVCEEAAHLTSARLSSLFLYDEADGALVPRGQFGHDPDVYGQWRLLPGDGLSGRIFASGQSLHLQGDELAAATSAEARRIVAAATKDGRFEGAAGVPLRVAGEVVGTLSVALGAEAFSQETVAVLELLALQVGLAIERHQHIEELEHRNQIIVSAHRAEQETYRLQLARQTLRDATWRMTTADDFMSVGGAVTHCLRSLGVPFFWSSVNLVEPREDPTGVRFANGNPHDPASARLVLGIWRSGKPGYRRDLSREDLHDEGKGLRLNYRSDIRCVLDVPFELGTIAVNSTEPEAFNDHHIDIIRKVGDFLAEGLRRRDDLLRLEQRTRELADSERQLSALQHIASATLSSLDMDDILDGLSTEILRAGYFRSLMVAVVDDERHCVSVVRSVVCRWDPETGLYEPGEISIHNPGLVTGFTYDLDDDNITAVTARTGELAVLDEPSRNLDDRFERQAAWGDKVAYFIPVKHGDRVVAVLATASTRADKEETLKRIETMSPLLVQVASALDHARLFLQVQEQRQQLADTNAELLRELDQQVATTELRERIWAMRGPEFLSATIVEIVRTIRRCGVRFVDCGINLILSDEDPASVRLITVTEAGEIRDLSVVTGTDAAATHGVARIVRFWKDGRTVVRRASEPAHGEEFKELLQNLGHPVAAVIDIPLSNGTLAFNSDQEDAFSDGDIGILADIARVVDEGVRRADDLQRLERSEETYRSMFHGVADALFVHDEEDGTIMDCNRSAADLLGLPHDASRSNLGLLCPRPPYSEERLVRTIHRARDRGVQQFEWKLIQPDGEEIWVEMTQRHMQVAGTWRVLSVVRDISPRVEARQMRRNLSLRALRSQEAERRRIARELHDGVNQILTAASARLHLATIPSEREESLVRARDHLDEAVHEIRRISRDLRPAVLDDLGLEPALRSLIRQFDEDYRIPVALHCKNLDGLSSELATAAYRFIQEGLTNVFRHAQAKHVSLAVTCSMQELQVQLQDDGAGFDVVAIAQGPGAGIGLRNLRERAELLDGSIQIDSEPGGGTCLNLSIPIPAEDLS